MAEKTISKGTRMTATAWALLRKIADEDRRSMSATLDILVKAEASKRGYPQMVEEPNGKSN